MPWGYCTVKGTTLYLHVFDWPGDGRLVLKGLRNKALRAYPLSAPKTEYAFEQTDAELTIEVPAQPLDAIDSVVVLEIEGSPQVAPTVVTQSEEGPIVLDYYAAVTAGRAMKRFNRKGLFHVSKWREPEDEVSWHVDVADPGAYQVSIEYAANADWEGQRFVIQTATDELSAEVHSTAGSSSRQATAEDAMGDCADDCIGSEYDYQTFRLGTVSLKAGEQVIRIRPAEAVPQNLMHLKTVRFDPSE